MVNGLTRSALKPGSIAMLGAVCLAVSMTEPACSSKEGSDDDRSGDAQAAGAGTESPDCTRVTAPGPSIVDGSGNVWSLGGAPDHYIVLVNGANAGDTANVKALVYANHRVYQTNANGGWWAWTDGAWNVATDPTETCDAPSSGVDASGGTDTSGTDAGPTVPPLPPSATSVCLPFAMPSNDALFASKKKVFAHYFYPFPLSIDNAPPATDYYNKHYLSPGGENGKWASNGGFLRARPLPVTPGSASTYLVENMKREVRLAIGAGITGFTIDVMNVNEANAHSHTQNLLAAASAVDPRFKILVMPDMSAPGINAAAVVTIVESVASSPAAYRLDDGRLVVAPFYANLQTASWWSSVLTTLSSHGIDVAFVPVFLGWGGNASAFSSISYGFSDWGTATAAAGTQMQSWPATAHASGKIFMLPVDPQQYRPKNFGFWEASNSAAFRNAWTSAIQGGADWVQLVTWSDLSESSQVMPYTDATLAGDIGTGFYNLNAYYASWYLTGQAPQLAKDVLYYFYRRESTTAAAPAQSKLASVISSTAENSIELLGFLTAPGRLAITVNGQTTTMDAPAGVTSFKVPLQAGTPEFSLTRNGAPVVSFKGGVTIYGSGGLPSGVQDLTYWSGSASADGICQMKIP